MSHKHSNVTTQILIALFAGLFGGLLINFINNEIVTKTVIENIFTPVGSLFINSIKMMVVPLVFVSLVCGVAGIGDMKKLGRVGVKTLIFYLITTALAITLALLVASAIAPGMGLNLDLSTTKVDIKAKPSLVDVIVAIVPSNPIKAMVEGDMLQVIFFSLLFGLAVVALGEKGKRVIGIFEDLNEIIMKMITIIMMFAPIGVFCLLGKVFAVQGMAAILPLLKYMISVMLALVLHLFGVYSMALKLIARLPITMFFRKFYPAMFVAFSTSSSNATIPVSMKMLSERLGVSKAISSFSVPFGATINMDGTAIMQGVAVVFISQVYGVHLGFNDYIAVILTATLASIGTAGVPSVGLITLSMVLTQVNLPVEGIALIMGVDRILDMSRTVVNISGDAVVALIVSKSEKELDEKCYHDINANLES